MDSEVCRRLNAFASANGVAMRCYSDPVFVDPRLQALHELWMEKAATDIPARSSFNLRSLLPFAKHLIILEREENGTKHRYKFRLFGSAHTFLFGDHTGHYLDDMVAPERLSSWLAFYDAVLEERQPLRIVTQFRIPNGVDLEAEIYAAPLRDEVGIIRQVLAVTFVDLRDYTSRTPT
jgi:hypothetical protein